MEKNKEKSLQKAIRSPVLIHKAPAAAPPPRPTTSGGSGSPKAKQSTQFPQHAGKLARPSSTQRHTTHSLRLAK
jgi:hypothetical protein